MLPKSAKSHVVAMNCSVRISGHFLLIYVALVSLYYVSCHDITLQTLQGHHATADVIES